LKYIPNVRYLNIYKSKNVTFGGLKYVPNIVNINNCYYNSHPIRFLTCQFIRKCRKKYNL